ncbi:hypothetical protein PHLGIDRAFT_280891 [Phlebiopsis gigantea 11061_1 CR5-6]|uniref:Oxo-4-hydroxy-4-carboxy-5-ureidoimidazoline decarboxylase domain-containing protein n=1 Tax=Phlebiopsis gigantea (strain 11061_1 CR5-6) TaxID=745531 RepID=A0A0C3SBG2_PHLG1|nr:hypothetical protein PHLGIDRAFT_280891 [Phlebiopsis gigantea 11061_1 CR5-6]
MSALPPIAELAAGSSDALTGALAVLFEPSPTLAAHLTPQVSARLQHTPVATYAALVDAALAAIAAWDDAPKARFIAGHPRIGEVKHLSALSAREQAAAATPPAVLARLRHLNACYEQRYPGLIYITFVNGRSRTAIMYEMEDVLGLERSLSATEPEVSSLAAVEVGGQEWRGELERAVQDVGRIAKSRLASLGVQ